MTPPARTRAQRVADTLARLDNDVDVWVASADPSSGTCDELADRVLMRDGVWLDADAG